MSPEVTVLTAVRNGAAHLPEAIASVRAQTYSDWEYLIVDDASQDATVAVVEEAMREDPRIRLIKREERGYPYAAANDGLREARGRYVVRLDADDVATPHRIEQQLAYLAANTSLRACAGGSRPMSSARPWRPTRVPPAAMRWELIVKRHLTHSSACVELDALKEIGLYRELRASQDLRLWCDLARRGWLGVAPSLVVLKRGHSQQLTAELFDVQRELAINILDEHIADLAGDRWARHDVAITHELQRCSSVPLRAGSRVLRRWKALWVADTSLGEEGLRYLDGIARALTRRLLFLRGPIATVLCRRWTQLGR